MTTDSRALERRGPDPRPGLLRELLPALEAVVALATVATALSQWGWLDRQWGW